MTRDFGDESRIRPTKAFGSVRCNPKLIGSSWVDFVGSAEWVGGAVYSVRRFRVTVLKFWIPDPGSHSESSRTRMEKFPREKMFFLSIINIMCKIEKF